jgi:hypothetical protein
MRCILMHTRAYSILNKYNFKTNKYSRKTVVFQDLFVLINKKNKCIIKIPNCVLNIKKWEEITCQLILKEEVF